MDLLQLTSHSYHCVQWLEGCNPLASAVEALAVFSTQSHRVSNRELTKSPMQVIIGKGSLSGGITCREQKKMAAELL